MKELIFSDPFPVYARFMDAGILLLDWPDRIDNEINNEVISISESIDKESNGIIDVVPAYASLGIFFNHHVMRPERLISMLKGLSTRKAHRKTRDIIEIPVCYAPEFGIDMGDLCHIHGLSHKEIVSLHIDPIYKVCFMGFLPGFAYLSGMSPKLNTPRRKHPRPKVPQGAVAIGGNQTGIYPISSPGGWNIIGRCPLRLFNINVKEPNALKSGDNIKFVSITRAEYESIEQKKINYG